MDPFRFVLISVAGWMNQQQQQAIDYLSVPADHVQLVVELNAESILANLRAARLSTTAMASQKLTPKQALTGLPDQAGA